LEGDDRGVDLALVVEGPGVSRPAHPPLLVAVGVNGVASLVLALLPLLVPAVNLNDSLELDGVTLLEDTERLVFQGLTLGDVAVDVDEVVLVALVNLVHLDMHDLLFCLG